MTKRRQAKDEGLRSHYLVRVVLPGALLHLASWDKPTWGIDADGQRTLLAEWIAFTVRLGAGEYDAEPKASKAS